MVKEQITNTGVDPSMPFFLHYVPGGTHAAGAMMLARG
jgi:hypothetical protein